jgi:hypothetical protein
MLRDGFGVKRVAEINFIHACHSVAPWASPCHVRFRWTPIAAGPGCQPGLFESKLGSTVFAWHTAKLPAPSP